MWNEFSGQTRRKSSLYKKRTPSDCFGDFAHWEGSEPLDFGRIFARIYFLGFTEIREKKSSLKIIQIHVAILDLKTYKSPIHNSQFLSWIPGTALDPGEYI